MSEDNDLEIKIIEILGDANKWIYQQKLIEYMKDCRDIDDLFNKLRLDDAGREILYELRKTAIGIDRILEARYNHLCRGEDDEIGFDFYDSEKNKNDIN